MWFGLVLFFSVSVCASGAVFVLVCLGDELSRFSQLTKSWSAFSTEAMILTFLLWPSPFLEGLRRFVKRLDASRRRDNNALL